MASPILTEVLAENLRRELRNRQWSQSELARQCGWPPARINEIMRGKLDPRLGTVEKVAEALEVAVAALLASNPNSKKKR